MVSRDFGFSSYFVITLSGIHDAQECTCGVWLALLAVALANTAE